MGLFAFLSIVTLSSAFLLDGNTESPTRVSLMTDTHFNMLMGLLHDERQSRIQLEKYVKQLQQDLINSKQEVHTQVFQNMNATFDKQLKDLKMENNKLKANNQNLKAQYDNLNLKLENFMRSQTLVKNDTLQLQQEVASLQNLKNVANLKTTLELDNKTATLGKTIEKTNNKLNQVANEAEARKQDFLALFNKADGTEKTLENKTAQLNAKLQNLTIQVTAKDLQLENDIVNLQNVTSLAARKLSDRVSVTTCSPEGTFGYIIKMSDIRTVNGLTNLSSLTTNGVFTCEKTGTYFVSVYLLTKTNNGGFNIKLNSTVLAAAFSSFSGLYQTGSASVLVKLAVHDRISVDVRSMDMYVYGGYHSCLTILQVQ